LSSHVSKSDSWDDPVLRRFWNELNRVEDKKGIGPLKDFRQSVPKRHRVIA
jgi:hypothetical protein